MLDYLRRSATSVVVKLLLFLLIASFAVWGIGDIFRTNTGGDSVASVGETNIGAARFRAEFAREIDRVGQILGQPIAREQAIAMGVDRMLLQRLINSQVMQEGANDMQLAASEAVVLNEIKKNSEFYNATGQFDRRVFVDVLSGAGLSEDMYVARVRDSIMRQQFLSPISGGAVAPTAMLDTLYKGLSEQRVLDVVRISHAKIKGMTAPGDADLAAYHTDNATNFMAPQYMSLTALVLNADELGKSITVTPDDMANAYDERAAEYTTAETRTLSQVLVKDETAAAKAAELLSGGAAIADAAAQVGANAAMIKLGVFTRAEAAALSDAIADAAFSTKMGGHSAPVKSPLGWHVLVVDTISPGHVRTMDEVKKELTQVIRAERTLNVLFEASNQLDDLLGSGMTLEEAASNLGVGTLKVAAVDATGLDANGLPIVAPYAKKLVSTAFALSEGSDSDMIESDDNKAFFVVRVDSVTPPALRPLSSVKKQVADAWMGQQRSAQADIIAAGVKARMEAGESAQAVARALGFDAFTTAPFNRLGTGLKQGALPATLMQETFTLNTGNVVQALGTGAHTVARLKSISPATVDTASDLYRSLHDRTLQDMQADLATQLSAALQRRHPVSINHKTLADLAN